MKNYSLSGNHSIAPLLESGHHFYFVSVDDCTGLSNEERVTLFSEELPWSLGEDPATGKRLLWVRARPKEGEGGLKGFLLAVDTNLGDRRRGLPLSPWVNENPENLTNLEKKTEWVEPYLFVDETRVPIEGFRRQIRFVFNATNPEFSVAFTLDLEIQVPPPVAAPVDVDLIIDLGNTRSVVLALEDNKGHSGALSQICQPVYLPVRDHEPNDVDFENRESAIIDSWFILSEPLFHCLEPTALVPELGESLVLHDVEYGFKETRSLFFWRKMEELPLRYKKRIPHSCVQLAPVVIGAEAKRVLEGLQILQLSGNFFLSSPKRYAWDRDPVGALGLTGASYWTMNVNKWSPFWSNFNAGKELRKLSATVLCLMDEDGESWRNGGSGTVIPTLRTTAAERPTHTPNKPSYPRSDSLTWMALAIIEGAFRFIQSEAWRRKMQQQFVRRRLREIVVTFPSGWTGPELDAYKEKWKKAIDTFFLGHLGSSFDPASTKPPVLHMEMDEAVASQLPYVYGEIERLGNIGENWIELVGRGRGENARVRIMNMDIGGGTSDVAIIDYKDRLAGAGVDLHANLLFKDSHRSAGDRLMLRIIEKVLLPAISKSLPESFVARFESKMRESKQSETQRWARVVRLVFVPIVRRWLADLSAGSQATSEIEPGVPPRASEICSTTMIDEFNLLCSGFSPTGRVLKNEEAIFYSLEDLKACIVEVFKPFMQSMAKFVSAFECDLLLVSGKVSELPLMKQLVEDCIPLPLNRIVFNHKQFVGQWYPMSSDGVVNDAKTVTVAGAQGNRISLNHAGLSLLG
jgi:hypothetical protein